jgi:Protein of unknown function (DUF2569)/GYF domain 2
LGVHNRPLVLFGSALLARVNAWLLTFSRAICSIMPPPPRTGGAPVTNIRNTVVNVSQSAPLASSVQPVQNGVFQGGTVVDIWYYADGGEPKGPFSFEELIEVLSGVPYPKQILVWGHGFEDWRPIDQVREIGAKLFKPPPLPQTAIQHSPRQIVSEPSVSVAEAAQFKNVRPDLDGIAGWLILVAIGQVLGPLRLLVFAGEYFEKMDKRLLENFPLAIWGEAAMYVGLLSFFVFTSVLFFRHSRKFPTFFIWQWMMLIALPFIDAAWAAISIGAYTGRNPGELVSLGPEEIGGSVAMTIGGAIWIAYILRSKRVANTFVK